MITSEWGTPAMVEDGVNPELLLARQVRQRVARVGPAHAASPADARARPRVPDGARAAARARSDRGLRLRRRRHQPEGSVGVDLGVAPRRATARAWRIRKVIDIPAEPADAGRSAAAAEGLRRGPAARDGHQPLARRSLPVRLVLGHGRAETVRRLGSLQSGRDRIGEARRHRRAAQPHPARPGPRAQRRAADGRDQPRRSASVRDQLALPHVGRSVLSRRDPRLAREGGRRPDRRHPARSRFFLEFDGMRPHQVHLEGGDASSDSYCFA